MSNENDTNPKADNLPGNWQRKDQSPLKESGKQKIEQ